MTYHLPAGRAAADGPYAVDVTPESAGWGYSGLRVVHLPPGAVTPSTAAGASGSCCR